MNRRIVRTIAVKDLREASQNRAALIPAIIIPMVLVVILPVVIILAPSLLNFTTLAPTLSQQSPVALIKENLPMLAAEAKGLNDQQTWILVMLGYFFAPLLLILPLMFSTIVGAESFVGEKERKTIEALLYTPATDGELFLGKMLASTVPAVALAWLSFLAYSVVVDAASWPEWGRLWFPTPNWWPLMLWVAPAIATLGMGVTVLISARVSTFMEAYQLTASLVVLVIALVIGQLTGVLYLNVAAGLVVGLVLWAIDFLLVWLGIRSFNREKLLLGA